MNEWDHSWYRAAIVHDWLVDYGGAERVVHQLHALFPDAPVYTLVYDRNRMIAQAQTWDIRTTYLQKLPGATRLYKNLLTVMPAAFEALDLTEYDLVISSSSSCSKGVLTRPDAVHICYCHTPVRYAWSHYHEYLAYASPLKRLLIPRLMKSFRQWDYQAAQRVDHFVANSRTTAQRIRKYYRRDAEVIYPCVTIESRPPIADGGYYLMVGRFVRYKRFDLGIEACSRLKRKLIVVGGGDEEKNLRAMAGDTVEFRGRLSDSEVRDLYRGAKAFLFPGEEDFGITPVEAQSAGCPVIAFGRGGATETVVDGRTGLFFHEQTVESLMECLEAFERTGVACSRQEIQEHSRVFSAERFCVQIKELVQRLLR